MPLVFYKVYHYKKKDQQWSIYMSTKTNKFLQTMTVLKSAMESTMESSILVKSL